MSARNDRRHMKKRWGKGKSSKLSPQAGTPKNPQEKAQQERLLEPSPVSLHPEMPESWFRSHVRSIVNQPYILLAGLLGTLFGLVGVPIALWGAPWPVDPEVRAATDAYSTPFTIVNKSGWFSMTGIEVICEQGSVDYGNPHVTVGNNFSFRPVSKLDPIAPGAHATFPCVGIPNLGPAISGTMNLEVGYVVRWHSYAIGKPHAIKATETYVQGKWIDGPII
jgi:hypothetical protein